MCVHRTSANRSASILPSDSRRPLIYAQYGEEQTRAHRREDGWGKTPSAELVVAGSKASVMLEDVRLKLLAEMTKDHTGH